MYTGAPPCTEGRCRNVFRKSFIPIKTLQKWMGHSDATMIMRIYAKLTNEREPLDITAINNFTKERFKN